MNFGFNCCSDCHWEWRRAARRDWSSFDFHLFRDLGDCAAEDRCSVGDDRVRWFVDVAKDVDPSLSNPFRLLGVYRRDHRVRLRRLMPDLQSFAVLANRNRTWRFLVICHSQRYNWCKKSVAEDSIWFVYLFISKPNINKSQRDGCGM